MFKKKQSDEDLSKEVIERLRETKYDNYRNQFWDLDSIEIEYNKVNLDKVTINIYKYGGDGQDYTYVYHYDGDEFFKIDFEKRIEKAIAKLKKKALIDNIRLEHILNVKLKYEKK